MRCVSCYFSPGLIRVVNGRWAGTYCQPCFAQVQMMAMQMLQRAHAAAEKVRG